MQWNLKVDAQRLCSVYIYETETQRIHNMYIVFLTRERFVRPLVEDPDLSNTENFVSVYIDEMKRRHASGTPTTMNCT